MNTAEIKELSTQELADRLANERVQYNKAVMNHAVSPLDNPASLRKQRRTIARMATLLNQRREENK